MLLDGFNYKTLSFVDTFYLTRFWITEKKSQIHFKVNNEGGEYINFQKMYMF